MSALTGARSLYLRRAAAEPVAWRPWGAEAFALAKAQNRPILLSSGFSACHWCAVMARESFHDPAIAAEINRLVVPVKLDREERPDIDHAYQEALERLGGRRGWPLTVFLTPKGEAFGGGGYFPPCARAGLPGLLDVVRAHVRRFETGALAPPAPRPAPARAETDDAAAAVLAQMDPLAGGLAGAPKFPHLPIIELLWRAGSQRGDARFAQAGLRALNAMSLGGLYDHLHGGFARYCVDAHWRTPHYEKLLIDNALFISVLTLAWRRTRAPLHGARVREIIAWLAQAMRTPGGAFAASVSAEAGGVPGGDRVFTHAALGALLGDAFGFFSRFYDIAPAGAGAEPLRQRREPRTEAERAQLARALARLRAAPRPQAERDDKIIAHWNGLAVRALAHAAGAFDEPGWLALARAAFDGAVTALASPDGALAHAPGAPGLLDDYAAMALGALALHEQTGEARYLAHAQAWLERLHKDFGAPDGAYRLSADILAPPIAAPREDAGGPSGLAMTLEALARLRLFAPAPWIDTAIAAPIGAHEAAALGAPAACAALLNSIDAARAPMKATLHGADDALRRALYQNAPPHAVITHEAGPGPARVIICEDVSCRAPILDAPELARAFAA